jgi:RNA-directed DNA polymerase
MRGKQQKSQRELAFMSSGEVKPEAGVDEGAETLAVGSKTESQAGNEQLMEEMLKRENLKEALKGVEENKGAGGVDGMRVEELRVYLKQHWPKMREELLSGSYHRQWRTGSSNRRCCKSYKESGTKRSQRTATGSGRGARRIKR